jgi:hypothetical protein
VYTNSSAWVKSRSRSGAVSDAAAAAAAIDVEPLSMVSNRRARRRKGSKKVTISSTDTLMDFKVRLMSIFNVMPTDQQIFHQGQHLTSDYNTHT